MKFFIVFSIAVCLLVSGCANGGSIVGDVCENAKAICNTANAICAVVGSVNLGDLRRELTKDSLVNVMQTQVEALQNSISNPQITITNQKEMP